VSLNHLRTLPPEFGLVNQPVGTHSSRTIMLTELSGLLASTTPGASYRHLQEAATSHNAVRKSSATGRDKTFRHLREFYALDSKVPVYAALRGLWDFRSDEQPMLAVLCASARDPVLRASGEVILALPYGSTVAKADVEGHLSERFPGRYSDTVLPRTVRNLLSSWTQSGHLEGHLIKKRKKATAGPASASYALFLGYLCGLRGEALFDTPWTGILDCSISDVYTYAAEASARGLITYKRAGGIVDVDVTSLTPATEGV